MTRPNPTQPWLFRLKAALVRIFYQRMVLHPEVSNARAERCLLLALERLEPERPDELLTLSMSDDISEFILENGEVNVEEFIEAALGAFDLNMEAVDA